MTSLRRWLREPLVHFILGGALLFGLYRVVHRENTGPVVITAEQRARLRADYVRRTGGEPTSQEAEALLQRHIEDELLLREAARLRLLDGDVIVRRRLLQKMQLLLEAQQAPPTDAEIAAHFSAHAERFAGQERVDLIVTTPGSPLTSEQRGRAQPELAAQLGSAFATRVFAMHVGDRAAIASTAGLLQVELVRRYTPTVTLADRRDEVIADLKQARGREHLATELAALRRRYPVELQ